MGACMLNYNRLGHRQLIVFITIVISLSSTVFSVVSCGFFQASYESQEAHIAFQKAIQTPVNPAIHLLTEKKLYHRKDEIGIWVENGSNRVLFFNDQSLGLKAYQYDQQQETWRLIDLGFTLGDPHATTVNPGPRTPLPSISIPVEWIKASGPLRLVITGTTDQGQPFAAYKDIEILD
jgi:hypothetical protein